MGCQKNNSPKTNIDLEDPLISIDTTSSSDSLIACESLLDITYLLEPFLLENYGEKKPLEIGYRELIFSTSGRFLAIYLNRLGSDQVWILDINKRHIQSALERDINKLLITSVYWSINDTLTIIARSENKHINFHSTIQGYKYEYVHESSASEFLNQVSPTGRYEINEITLSKRKAIELNDLENNRKTVLTDTPLKWWDISNSLSWSPLDKYFFFIWNHGHGELSLYAGITEPKFKLVELSKGWYVQDFAVSPMSQEIAYPDRYCIIIYNVEKNNVSRKIQTGAYPGVMAWSNQNYLAFTANYCQKTLDTLKKKNRFLPLGNRRLYLVKL